MIEKRRPAMKEQHRRTARQETPPIVGQGNGSFFYTDGKIIIRNPTLTTARQPPMPMYLSNNS